MEFLTAKEARQCDYETEHGIAYSHISDAIADRWVKQELIQLMYRIANHYSRQHILYPVEFMQFPERIEAELTKLGYHVWYSTEIVLGKEVKYMNIFWGAEGARKVK